MTKIVPDTPRVLASVTQLFPIAHAFDEQAPDERESVRLYVETHPEFLTKFPGHTTELRNVYTGGSYFGLGGTRDGSDAA